MLAKAWPNGDPITTLSTCLCLLLNLKKDSMVAMLSKFQKPYFGIFWGFPLSFYKLSTQISMVSSRGIFVDKESMSGLAMCKLESCWQISAAIWNEWMTVYSLVFEGVKIFSKSFANL